MYSQSVSFIEDAVQDERIGYDICGAKHQRTENTPVCDAHWRLCFLTSPHIGGRLNMQSSLIGKIQKAHLYAREPDRVTFVEFATTFRGENDTHNVAFRSNTWSCDCHFFETNSICSHVMAIQKLLGSMLPAEAQYWPATEVAQAASVNGHGI